MASSSSSTHFISSEELLVLRQYSFSRKWGEKVMLQIFECSLIEKDPSKKLLKVIEDNGVPTTGRKSPFMKYEVDKITSEPSLESLDITLLHKIYQNIWDKRLNNPRNTLKDEIKANPDKELVDLMNTYAKDELREKMVKYPDYELLDLMLFIKNKRNEVSHVKDKLTEKELDERLKEFGVKLKEGLDKAGALYPCHNAEFMKLKVDIGDSIEKIQKKIREPYDPTNPDHLERLLKEVEEFGNLVHDFICEKSAVDLRSISVYRCKIPPLDWFSQYGPINPEELMVPLTMDVDKDLHDQSHKCDVAQKEILDKKNPGSKEPNVIIISGDAGSGKTTLLRWFLEKWLNKSTDDNGLSNFPLVLYMEFREHDSDHFDKFLRDLLPHQVAKFGFDQVKSAILLSKCLVLCDGFDEKNQKSLKLFEEILKENFKVIVTTRPGNKTEVTRIINHSGKESLNLTMKGLQDKDIKVLIPKLTKLYVREEPKRDEMTDGITSTYISMSAEMKQVLRTPLYCVLFVVLYIDCTEEERQELKNETNLFTLLNDHRSERLKTKCKLDDEKISEFDKFYKEWSLRYFLQGKYELGEDDIKVFKGICSKHLDGDSIMSSYFTIKHTRKGLKIVPIYAYRHRTEQEFAAAGAICDILKEKKNELDDLTKKGINKISHCMECIIPDIAREENKDLGEIMKFVTGILFNSKEKALCYSVLKDSFHHCAKPSIKNSSLLDHVLETKHDDKVVDAVVEAMGNSLREEGLIVSRKYLSCVRPLVSKIQPKSISFNLPPKDDHDNHPHLIQALQSSSEIISVDFTGRLNERGIEVLPSGIERLLLSLQLQDMPHLVKKIPDLVQLNFLLLYLDDDGSFDHHERLSPIPYTKGDFLVNLTLTSVVPHDSLPERVIKLTKAIWPTVTDVKKDDSFRWLYLSSDDPSYEFTGDVILQLLNTLTIASLDQILIVSRVSDDAKRRKEELESICSERGLGLLRLMKRR